ncbi:MAG: hypothetical protein AAB582_02260, partial [Patescibacteria group bacterium]
DSFPMVSYWNAKNIGKGSGSYALGPVGFNTNEPYQAVTSDMDTGGTYATQAVISWDKSDDALVSGSCRTGKDYRLEGYSVGDSLAEAEANGPSEMTWAKHSKFTQDKYVIVWYRHCLEAPEHLSPKNGATRTTAEQESIDWSDVTSAFGDVTYAYESSLSKTFNEDGSFQTPTWSESGLSVSEKPTPGTPPGTYYWHVKAVDSKGNESWWSNPWRLNVIANP